MKFLTLLLSLLLLGCAAEEHQDLREWMRDEAKGMRGKVAPLPEITAFPVVAYETETLTPPFAPGKIVTWTSARTRAHRIARARNSRWRRSRSRICA
jgi:Tfp pilus assembly protein PilP